MHPLLVADIGGTNARYALAVARADGRLVLTEARTYQTASFDSFEASIDAYLADLNTPERFDATLAVAGPVVDDTVLMTNLGWRVDARALEQHARLGSVHVINDFVAMAWATAMPEDLELAEVKPGEARSGSPRLIIGPGTGLGVAGMVPAHGNWIEVPGEGGHVACPRYAAFPDGVFEQLSRAHPGLFLELVLSGRGLVNLHRAMAAAEGVVATASSPREVCEAAASGEDPLCVRTAQTFCLVLACAARDFALVYGALGGVYLAGGILPRLQSVLLEVPFAEQFGAHPTYANYLSGIPVNLIRHGQAAMLGAAAWTAARAGDTTTR